MTANSLGEELIDWATSQSGDFDIKQLDRTSPAVIAAFKYALGKPANIVVVEQIEGLTKLLWSDILEPSNHVIHADGIACSDFFSELGFLFKYKPYGIKIASPFGYSIFDLKEGQGFSFQVHNQPKLEGFHVLQTKQRSLIYISSREEWKEYGQAWAHANLPGDTGKSADPPFVWRPENGDVIEVSKTEIVHSALGCVLEEYASCSVDAVERLFDQNARLNIELPTAHPSVADILTQCRPGLPVRRIDRTATGWRTASWSKDDAIIEVENDLWGSRIKLSSDSRLVLPSSPELLKLIVAVDRTVEVEIGGRSRYLPRGSFVCITPGLDIALSSPSGDCSVAVHCVSRALIKADWKR